VSLPAPDTTPDAFTFTDVTGAAVSTVTTSAAVTITGINAPVTFSATGGTIDVNSDGNFLSSRSVSNGNTIRARATSSASNSTGVDVVVTGGGVSDTFTVTTAAAASDTTPDAFAFTDVTGATLSTVYTSNAITVAGINAPATITVSGGTYDINASGTFVSTSGAVNNGDTVRARVTSSGSNSTAANVVVTIGGVSDTYSVTTVAAAAPDAPVVTWSTGTGDNTPEFDIDLTSPQVGDVVTLEISASNTFTSPTTYTDTLDSGEVAAGEVIVTIAALANGTWYARAKVTRASVDSAWSNTASQTIAVDTTAPTLSSPTGTQTGQTTATLGVTTNEANGTLYAFVSTSATPPSATALKAGTGAAFANNQAITTTGAKTASATGLTASTGYYVHWLHRDAAGNESTIATSAQFTTAAASGYATQMVRFSGSASDTVGHTMSGGASSTQLTLSFWFRKNGGDGTDQIIFSLDGNAVIAQFTPANKLHVYSAGIWEAVSATTFTAGSAVYHALVSVDVATSAVQLYINDASDVGFSNTYSSSAINMLNKLILVGSDGGGGLQLDGDVGDIWFNPGTRLDLSVASNRRKFISATAKPVDLGASGATPTGSSPLFYLSGALASWTTNKGTGGGLSIVNGTRGDGGTYS
jgi:hypothetical protein